MGGASIATNLLLGYIVKFARSAGGHVATGVIQDPPFPFHTISIDHKTVTAPRATGYQYILVVVDMLTRFVTAIPTKTMSAEETLTALMEHVFTNTPFHW
eukprot:6212535-Pleurochrysis_carterae.AAC.4